MTYSLIFRKLAARQWNKLGANVRAEFEGILRRRLESPHVPAARLRGAPNLYKVKLRSAGYRLAYIVHDGKLIVMVVGVGRRDEFYETLVDIGKQSFSEFD